MISGFDGGTATILRSSAAVDTADVARLLVSVMQRLDTLQGSIDSVQQTTSNNQRMLEDCLQRLPAKRESQEPGRPWNTATPPTEPPGWAPDRQLLTLAALAACILTRRRARHAVARAARRMPLALPLGAQALAAFVLLACNSMDAARKLPLVALAVPCQSATRDAAWRSLLVASTASTVVLTAKLTSS
mmetsp:Transcript_46584/g.129465  ORF Transcript_46584/g.129465 Transcript_46584/m.129465 type:complete len:189 (+) Transcript_46584:56-622(+)